MITIEYIDNGKTRTLTFKTPDSAAEWYLNSGIRGCAVNADTRIEHDRLWSMVEGEMHT